MTIMIMMTLVRFVKISMLPLPNATGTLEVQVIALINLVSKKIMNTLSVHLFKV